MAHNQLIKELSFVQSKPPPNMCINTQLKHHSSSLDRVETDISLASNDAPSSPSIALHLLFLLLPPSVLVFSLTFPFMIPFVSTASHLTFLPASYNYTSHSKFDDSPWTYLTDYLLALFMSILAFQLLRDGPPSNLRYYSASLMTCYAVSTLAGGYAHHMFPDRLNSTVFRMLWTCCVGSVGFASFPMGSIGGLIAGVTGGVPRAPWYFWPYYGSFAAVAAGMGWMSFQRPACDIFIAGITQFPATAYCVVGLGLGRDGGGVRDRVGWGCKHMYYVGFIGNAPLLPMYPLLVQYSGMSLAGINTLLHAWLLVMWGMQGISLFYICRAVDAMENKVIKGE